jgi:hypothetical protein
MNEIEQHFNNLHGMIRLVQGLGKMFFFQK